MGFSSHILQRLTPRCLLATQLLPSAPWQLQPGLIFLLANLGTALTPAHVRGIEGSDSIPASTRLSLISQAMELVQLAMDLLLLCPMLQQAPLGIWPAPEESRTQVPCWVAC